MEVFKDSTEQALRGRLNRGDGTILVALNICPGASAIINPLCSSGSIVTPPLPSEIIKPTSLVMGEWANKFSQYKYYCFCVYILYYKHSEIFIYKIFIL
jgi:hypothetical protein